ncbi:MAG: asparagine synthetase B [Candidatus Diapherotrites archaeon]|nr:asparagine synthetase B [Candidatus Diapherotrites archaeon]
MIAEELHYLLDNPPKPAKGGKGELKKSIVASIDKNCKGLKEAGLLFSGGVDSTLLAVLLRDRLNLHCYCAGIQGSQDLEWSKRVAKELGLNLKTIIITKEELEQELPKIVKLVGPNIMKVGVATPFYFCMREAKEKVFFSGLGTEELFAGYHRHENALRQGGYRTVEEEIVKGLKSMWERDITRDTAVAKAFNKGLRVPFLDEKVIAVSLGIPAERKIKLEPPVKKLVLREIALELGVPKEVAWRPKKAAQYGSGVDKVIRKVMTISRRNLNKTALLMKKSEKEKHFKTHINGKR